MLGIIIVNYKNEGKTIEYVKEELIKIQTQNIIVVVNNSATDESNARLQEGLSAELVHDITKVESTSQRCFIVSHPDNLGFARGNNLGAEFLLKHFPITYFLFSNNDIRFIDAHVVEALIEKADGLPNVGVIGPNIIGVDGHKQSPDPYYPFWARYFWMYWLTPFLPRKVKNNLFKLNYAKHAKEGVHYRVMGSFFLVPATIFVACGMMDPNTFLFSEEMILSERMRAIGRDVYFYPAVTILHEHSQTISKFFADKKKFMIRFESECYYYRTYRNVSLLSTYIGKLSFLLYISLRQFERKIK